MTDYNTTRHVLYIDKLVPVPGWYWTERQGNRMIYIGPFKTEEAAKLDMEIDTKRESEKGK